MYILIFDRHNNLFKRYDRVLKFSCRKVLNGFSNAKIELPYDEVLTPANFCYGNKVHIYVDEKKLFTGFINTLFSEENAIGINLLGDLRILSKRLCTIDETTDQAKNIVSSILAQANAEDDTGISIGTNDVAQEITVEFKNEDCFSALRKVAEMTGSEMDVADNQLNFTSSIGEDKSLEIIGKYIYDRPNETNILGMNYTLEGDQLTTKVTAKSGSLTSIRSDEEAIDNFGVQHSFCNFPQAKNQGTLDTLAQKYIDEHKALLTSPKVIFDPTKISVAYLHLGDVIGLIISDGFWDVNTNYEITEIQFTTGVGGQKLEVFLSSNKQSRTDLRDSFYDIDNRLNNLEKFN